MPGLMDGFGDRLLMFDNTDADPLEMLRFHATLADTPGFEDVLRDRVRRLGRLTHPAFPVIRAVDRLEADGSLVLVSTYAPGKRLSALLTEPQVCGGLHPAFVTWVVSQVIQPLSLLQSGGADFAHGAMTADRVILTTDGRVRIVEHVLGSALRHLNRSSSGLWREFGVLAPTDRPGAAPLDARADVFQLGVLALSMLLARRITPADLEQRLPLLLDQWSNRSTIRSRLFGDSLRLWLERALQIGDRPYRSAADAHADLRQLPAASASRAFEFLQADDVNGLATPLVILQSSAQSGQEALMANLSLSDQVRINDSTPPPETPPVAPANVVSPVSETPWMESKASGADATSRLLTFAPTDPPKSIPIQNRAVRTSGWQRARLPIAVGLSVIALVEAIVIATMFVRQQPASPTGAVVAASPASEVSAQLPTVVAGPTDANAGRVDDQNGLTVAEATPDTQRNADVIAAAIAKAASSQRSGGVRLAAPIELKVLQGDRVLGSSADGPIVATAGTHQLDFINTSFGFRVRRAVTFRAGEITTLSIDVPPGSISVNAEPWAEVWIDNRPVGETPLAHLEIPVGEHEVVFRHPDKGERRQNVVVRADSVTRASATFE